MQATLAEIAALIQGEIIGDGALQIQSLCSVDGATAHSLIFADGDDNLKKAAASQASAVLVAEYVKEFNKPIIRVAEPLAAFVTLLKHYHPEVKVVPSVHPTAVIADDVVLGADVYIGPYVVIESGSTIGANCVLKGHVYVGRNVTIGANTTLHPQVTLYDNCKLGERVIIHASTVLGSDGFGYSFKNGEHMKIPHVGRVEIGNDIEIGANSVVDRATLGATVIGDGTKIDNLVQIAHSVRIGKHNILCAFTGIAGSSTTGDHVIFAADVGVSDHVTIEDGVVLGARAGVPPKKVLKRGNVYLGNPARPKDKALEQELSSARVPMMRKNLISLSQKVTELTERVAQMEQATT